MSNSVETSTEIRTFNVDVPEGELVELRRRLAGARWPTGELVEDSSQGVQLATLRELVRYWGADYDWRRVEARLNALPQFMTEIDGVDIHFIQVKSPHEDALPLIITHGWPGSVIELLEVVGPLTDPTAHGGSAEDAFDLVLPSLPGYGFSGQPREVGWDPARIGQAWAELMNRLGYTRYVAQGGDQGASVTDAMARQAPRGLLGIHLNWLSAFPQEVGAALFGSLVPAGIFKRVAISLLGARAEKKQPEALDALAGLFRRGYIVEMPEHPQTIGYALTDTPVGLAAWMLDHDADSYQKISDAFVNDQPAGGLTRERIVDNITLYWLTNTATSSARLYWEGFRTIFAAIASGAKPADLSLPVAFTVFPGEIFQAPRSWAEKVYPNLVYWNEVDRGGHFAAWEQPQLFADEMRAAFRSLRPGGSS
jgi:pimeloyl-ACP methyl ester carboxylesterase